MAELILIIILFGSFFGMGVILYRKMPALANLSESPDDLPQISEIIQKSKDEVKKIPGVGKLDHELFLQKILSKIRILTLKTENQTGVWLERLRKKRNSHDKDDYWQELKKTKNGKKPA